MFWIAIILVNGPTIRTVFFYKISWYAFLRFQIKLKMRCIHFLTQRLIVNVFFFSKCCSRCKWVGFSAKLTRLQRRYWMLRVHEIQKTDTADQMFNIMNIKWYQQQRRTTTNIHSNIANVKSSHRRIIIGTACVCV